MLNSERWRIIERFCLKEEYNPLAFEAFAELVDRNQEEEIRQRVEKWSSDALEQLSLLICGGLDAIPNSDGSGTFFQCAGLYLTGTQNSLISISGKEIPRLERHNMAAEVKKMNPEAGEIVIGSHIIPTTWVHGFSWKQWRAALARDAAMFERPSRSQPHQAAEAQAWMLPIFHRRELFVHPTTEYDRQDGTSSFGRLLMNQTASVFQKIHGSMPPDIRIHPIVAAAHESWCHAKMIAFTDWLAATITRLKATGQSIRIVEQPRGSVQIQNARTSEVIAELNAAPSFPVDGTQIAIRITSERFGGL